MKIVYSISVLVVLLVIAVAYVFRQNETVSCKPVLTVWPYFDVIEADPDLGYVAEGVSVQITDRLARQSQFDVSWRTDPPPDTPIGLKHWTQDSDFYVNGSVHVIFDQIRIIVHLFDVRRHDEVWSGTFEMPVQIFFKNDTALMSQIAQGIVSAAPDSVQRAKGHRCVAP